MKREGLDPEQEFNYGSRDTPSVETGGKKEKMYKCK